MKKRPPSLKQAMRHSSGKQNLARYGVVAGAVLTVIHHAGAEGHAHTGKEIAAALPMYPETKIREALAALQRAGAVILHRRHFWAIFPNPSPGERLYGPHASAEQRIAAQKAIQKASAFYDNPKLVTAAKVLKGYRPPKAFVDIGEFISIEYDSAKFDGRKRIYHHETEVKRKCLLSIDGSTMVFVPPFRVTRKGIEG